MLMVLTLAGMQTARALETKQVGVPSQTTTCNYPVNTMYKYGQGVSIYKKNVIGLEAGKVIKKIAFLGYIAADNWKVNEAGMPVMRVAYKAPNGLLAEAVLGSELRISTAEGSITLGADTDTTVTVYNVSGMAVALVNLSAGHDETIMLPAGIYLVGNQKVIVK